MKIKSEKKSQRTEKSESFLVKLKKWFSGVIQKLSERFKLSKKAVVIILSSFMALVVAAVVLVLVLSGGKPQVE